MTGNRIMQSDLKEPCPKSIVYIQIALHECKVVKRPLHFIPVSLDLSDVAANENKTYTYSLVPHGTSNGAGYYCKVV
jgi:hypothetical protein